MSKFKINIKITLGESHKILLKDQLQAYGMKFSSKYILEKEEELSAANYLYKHEIINFSDFNKIVELLDNLINEHLILIKKIGKEEYNKTSGYARKIKER